MFDSFSFGHIEWKGKDYPFDVVVVNNQIQERGKRDNNHLLEAKELTNYLTPNTKKLIIGTGDSGILEVAEDARVLAESKGIEWVALLSKKAIELFNLEEDKSIVVAVIHSTC